MLLAGAAWGQDAPAVAFKVSLALEERRLDPDRPMPLRFTIENPTDKELDVDVPADWLDGLELVDDQNRKVKSAGAAPAKLATLKVQPRSFFGKVVDIAPALRGLSFDEGVWKATWKWGGAVSNEVKPVVMREYVATVETNFGDIKVGFYPADAPRHVVNFLRNIRDKAYDDCRFYRVVTDVLVQGGPNSRTAVKGIPLEISERRHVYGALGMARATAPDSATTEFYLCLRDIPKLDGHYTVFGTVLEGSSVLAEIGKVKVEQERPKAEIVIKRITLAVKESK